MSSCPYCPYTYLSRTPSLGLCFTLGTEMGARFPLWRHVPSHLSPAPRGGHQLCTLCLQVFSGLWSGLPEGPCSALSGLCVELQSAGSLASGQETLSEGNSLNPFPFPVLGGNSCVWWTEPLEPVFTLCTGTRDGWCHLSGTVTRALK